MPKTTQKRQSTVVRQGQILVASRKLIIKYGSENITVRRIAQAIGVSEGAIYRHFKSKRDILSLLVEDIEDTWLRDIEASHNQDLTPLQMLDKIAKTHISLAEQRRGISFQVIAEIISLGDKKLNSKIATTIQKYTDHVKQVLSEAGTAGEIRPRIDLEAAAIMFFSMTQGLVSIWVLAGYDFNLEQKYANLWEIFRQSLIER